MTPSVCSSRRRGSAPTLSSRVYLCFCPAWPAKHKAIINIRMKQILRIDCLWIILLRKKQIMVTYHQSIQILKRKPLNWKSHHTSTLKCFNSSALQHDNICDCAALAQGTWLLHCLLHKFLVLYCSVYEPCICEVYVIYKPYVNVYGLWRWWESHYVNECISRVSGMSWLPASVTVCLLVTAETYSIQTWINNGWGGQGLRGGGNRRREGAREEGSVSPVNSSSCIHTWVYLPMMPVRHF